VDSFCTYGRRTSAMGDGTVVEMTAAERGLASKLSKLSWADGNSRRSNETDSMLTYRPYGKCPTAP
jgi:hypothetical protein